MFAKLRLPEKILHNIFPNIGMSKCSIHIILKTQQRLYFKLNCLGANWKAITMNCECALSNIVCGVVRYRTAAPLSDKARCDTVVDLYKSKLHLNLLIGDLPGHN